MDIASLQQVCLNIQAIRYAIWTSMEQDCSPRA